jgi:hypothetical protein
MKGGTVSEGEIGQATDHPLFPAQPQIAVERPSPQSYNHFKIFEPLQLGRQVGPAGSEFARQGFILGRRAFDGIADEKVVQHQPILPIKGQRTAGESSLMQQRIHEISGAVTGKRPAGTIGAMGSRRQTDKQNPGLRVSEAGHRTVPVLRTATPFRRDKTRQVVDQPRTAPAASQILQQYFGTHA